MTFSNLLEQQPTTNPSLTRVGISIPQATLTVFDQTLEAGGYSSRSEGIREAMRYYIQHYEWINEVKGDRVAVISFVYDPDQTGIAGRLNAIERKFKCVIKTSFQWQLEEGDFMRLLALHGDAELLRKVDERLMALKGVKHVKLTTISPENSGKFGQNRTS